jgi:hypothetical protein
MIRLTEEKKHEILRLINKGLEWQFSVYSWEDMIDDCLVNFTKEEINWAKHHTGYKAYIYE